MTELPRFTRADSTVEAIDLLHDAAMSKDPLRACEGRMGKRFTNAFDAFWEDEVERGTDPALILVAARSGAISMFFTVLANAAPQMLQAEIAQRLRDSFIEQFDRCVEELRRDPLGNKGSAP